MLTAVKSKPFEAMFSIYNKYYLIGRRFRSFSISGSIDPAAGVDRPILYIMNHSSWWDGLLVYLAVRMCSVREHYMMMEEEQLQKYRFFRKIGAYSIQKTNPNDIRASLQYTAALLNKGAGAWIFPQGEIRHLEARPLRFRPGIGLLLRQIPQTAVVPVTLYHGLRQHDKPEASIRFGEQIALPWREISSRNIAELLEGRLTNQLDQHKQIVLNSAADIPQGFESLIGTGRSINEWFDVLNRNRNRP